MRLIRLSIPLLAAAALLALPVAAAAAQAPSPPTASTSAAPSAPGFVGSDLCVTCHTPEADRLAKTPHGKSKFATLSAHGCETCHGPGSAHVEDPDNPALQPRIDEADACASSRRSARSCHAGGTQFFWHGSVHETPRALLPELPQRPRLQVGQRAAQGREHHRGLRLLPQGRARGDVEELAPSDPRGQDRLRRLPQPARHPDPQADQGRLGQRAVLHLPHREARPLPLGARAGARELPELPHPARLEPPEAAEDRRCRTCASSATPTPGTPARSTTATTPREIRRAASNRLFNRACLDCHAAVHGSNHPSSPYLAH